VKAAAKAGYTTVKEISQRIGELEVQQALFKVPPSSDMKPATWEKRYERLDKDLATLGLKPLKKSLEVISEISEKLLSYRCVDDFVKDIHGADKYLKEDDLIHMDESGTLVSIPAEIMRQRPNLQLPSLLRRGEATLSSTTTELAYKPTQFGSSLGYP
jgi:hypothetical protein